MNEDKDTLIFEIEYIIKYLKSDNLTKDYNDKLTNFIENLNIDELILFQKLAEDFKYNKKYLGWKKYKISKNSIDLMIKIFEHTEIKVFPYVSKVAGKGWSISDGSFAWGMYRLDGEYPTKQIYSDIRANECLKKCYELEYDIYMGNDFINLKETE